LKYFTRQWRHGDCSDHESEATVAAYRAHIDRLLPRLPQSLKTLVQDVSLHDGLIVRGDLDRRRDTFSLELRCGDLHVGYFDLELRYRGVNLGRLDVALLAKQARDPGIEILYDELDVVSEDRYLHSILFSTDDEIQIEFSTFDMTQTVRSDRSIPHVVDRFLEQK
jgi:hypothetical protein